MSDTAPWTPNEAVAFLNRALDRWAEQSGTSVSIEAGNVVGLRDFIIEWSRRDAVASSCAAVPALTREQIAQAIRDSNPHMGESPEMIALTLHYADAILAMPRAAAPSPTGGATDRAAAAVSAANYGNWDSLHYTAGTQVDTTCQEMDIWDLATKLFTQSAHNATSDPAEYLIVTTFGIGKQLIQSVLSQRTMPITGDSKIRLPGGYVCDTILGIPMVMDPYCPLGTLYLLHLPSINWVDALDCAPVQSENSGTVRFVAGADAYEISMATYMNTMTKQRNAHGSIIGYTDSTGYNWVRSNA